MPHEREDTVMRNEFPREADCPEAEDVVGEKRQDRRPEQISIFQWAPHDTDAHDLYWWDVTRHYPDSIQEPAVDNPPQ